MAARQAGERYNFSIKYSVKIAEASCLVRPWCFACVLSWLFLPIWLVILVITWTLRRLITLHLKLQRVWFILWSNQIRLSRGKFTWIINVGHCRHQFVSSAAKQAIRFRVKAKQECVLQRGRGGHLNNNTIPHTSITCKDCSITRCTA